MMVPVRYPTRAGEPYRPSNGTEGEMFMADWCDLCAKEAGPNRCEILTATFCHQVNDPEYPRDKWVYGDDGRPTCRSYETRRKNARR
jgi:hypothetical protein